MPLIFFVAALSITWGIWGQARHPIHDDLWFDSDTGWVYWNVTDIHAVHRTSKHPIFSLLTFPVVKTLAVAGFAKATAVKILFCSVAGLWAAIFYIVLLQSLKRPLDAAVFTLLGISSSAFLFWSWAPETFAIGSISILLALGMFHMKGRWQLPAQFAASFFSLGVTVTNWSAALLVSVFTLRKRTAAMIAILALAAVTTIGLAEARFLKTRGFFLNVGALLNRETAYVNHGSAGPIADRWRIFLAGGVVLPGVEHRMVEIWNESHPMLSAQTVSAPWRWRLTAALWLALLAAGCISVLRIRTAFGWCLLANAAFHLILHSVYGYETFLYTMHFVPILIILASQTVKLHRAAALAAAGILIPLCVINNWPLLQHAFALLKVMQGSGT